MKRAAIVFGLTSIACALAAVIALELLGGVDENADAGSTTAMRSGADAAMTRRISSTPATASEVTASILARPLFAQDRMPESAVSTKDATDFPRLAGIVTILGKKLAIFQPRGGGKAIVGGVGTAVDGRKIQAISVDEIVMTGPGGTERVRPLPDPSLQHVSQPAQRAPFATEPAPRTKRHIGVTP